MLADMEPEDSSDGEEDTDGRRDGDGGERLVEVTTKPLSVNTSGQANLEPRVTCTVVVLVSLL